MKKKLLNMVIVLFLIFSVFISCGSPAGSGVSSGNSPSGIVVQGSGTIGPEGGSISAGTKLTITIPSGALSDTVKISAKYVDSLNDIHSDKAAFPVGNFLSMAEFGPSGTEFVVPVDVTIKLNSQVAANKISVYCYNELEDKWIFITDAEVSGTNATFKITHFSKYAVLDITPEMMSTFSTICKNGLQNGKSDQEIIDQFKNYLINDCGVMKTVTKWNGYYYKPMTLSVGGNYFFNGQENSSALNSRYGQEVPEDYKGITTTAALTTSKDFLDKVKQFKEGEGSSEDCFVSDVYVVVYYEMIVPEIIFSSSNTELSTNISQEVNVLCYYNDGDIDLTLDGYRLSLSLNPTNIFELSTKTVTTDSDGKAKFILTGKKEGDAEVCAKFSATDVEGKVISISKTEEFSCKDEIWHAEGIIQIDAKKSFHPDPYRDFAVFKCPDHTFKCSVFVSVDFKLVEKKIKGKNIIVPDGKATIKCLPESVVYNYPDFEMKIVDNEDDYVCIDKKTFTPGTPEFEDLINIPVTGYYDPEKGVILEFMNLNEETADPEALLEKMILMYNTIGGTENRVETVDDEREERNFEVDDISWLMSPELIAFPLREGKYTLTMPSELNEDVSEDADELELIQQFWDYTPCVVTYDIFLITSDFFPWNEDDLLVGFTTVETPTGEITLSKK